MTAGPMRPRIVAVETLDGLAQDHPAAMRSRRDLRRVHGAMGTRSIVLRALRTMQQTQRQATPLKVLELGAGDGSLMLGVAQALASAWPPVELTLLDRQSVVERTTIERYAGLGWSAVAQVIDVHDWAAAATHAAPPGRAAARWDLIIANLFLHHFEDAQLVALLGAVAATTDCFFACEPRRDWIALAGSHLVGVIGANAVTREDAVLSVHAGFRGKELTALWPASAAPWQLQEYPAGLFSHCFRAQRGEAN
nr:class I SAM-dependent methyltransferase [Rhodoferax sp.]